MQLLSVQHGGRESVEMFEVTQSSEGWALAWRGCVIAPKGSMINDVVATPDGGFLVTHMMPKSTTFLGKMYEFMKVSLLGIKSGYVLVWQPNLFRIVLSVLLTNAFNADSIPCKLFTYN